MARPLAFAALFLALPAPAEAPRPEAPDGVREVLDEDLDRGEVDDLPRKSAFERRMRRDVAGLLSTEGHFSPRVSVRDEDGEWVLVVDPGPRSLVGCVAIDLVGDLGGARREQISQGWKLTQGQPFRQADRDGAKQSLIADLLPVDCAGGRPRELIDRFNRGVRPGDGYREDRLLALQAALQSTPFHCGQRVARTPPRGFRCRPRSAVAAGGCCRIRTSCAPACATARETRSVRAMRGSSVANSASPWQRRRRGSRRISCSASGGSNSVRGYAYQSLGVREGSAIVGGR